MFEGVIQKIGKEGGPTSIILAGVHGDERCGIEAFEAVLPTLEIERGMVFFGYGNPRAIEQKRRFTEANLNRMFRNDDALTSDEKKSYEYDRAQILKQYLNQAEALLDLHASQTPKSKPFLICEANAKGIAEYLPLDVVVSGFDAVEPGGTDFYMNSVGKIGICVECGYAGDSYSVEIAKQSIFAFLKARDHVANDESSKPQTYIQVYNLYKTKTDRFSLSKVFLDFETVAPGQIIGIDGDETIYAEKESVILFARNRGRAGEEAFLLGGKMDN